MGRPSRAPAGFPPGATRRCAGKMKRHHFPLRHRSDVPMLGPLGQERVPEQPPRPVDAQHAQAIDTIFATEDENSAAAGLIGLSLGLPALIDILAEEFRRPPDDDEQPRKKSTHEPNNDAACVHELWGQRSALHPLRRTQIDSTSARFSTIASIVNGRPSAGAHRPAAPPGRPAPKRDSECWGCPREAAPGYVLPPRRRSGSRPAPPIRGHDRRTNRPAPRGDRGKDVPEQRDGPASSGSGGQETPPTRH